MSADTRIREAWRPFDRRSRRALVGLSGVVVVLLAVLLGLLVTAFAEVRGTTREFSESALAITDLANVQRELLATARDIERIDTDPDAVEDLALHVGLWRQHWRATRNHVDLDVAAAQGSALPMLDRRITAVLDELVVSLDAPDAAAAVAVHTDELRELDRLLKQEYARGEVRYHDVFRRALLSRGSSSVLILVVFGAVLASGLAVVVVGRRFVLTTFDRAKAELAAVRQRHTDLVDQVREAIIRLDETGAVELVNPGWVRLTGTDEADTLGRPLTDFVTIDPEEEGWSAAGLPLGDPTVGRVGKDGVSTDGVGEDRVAEVRLGPGSARDGWAELSMRPSPGGWVATLVDVTARVVARHQLTTMAHRDALTGLGNRAALLAQLPRSMANAQRRRRTVGLIFIDLDRFKVVNDSLGHDVGDGLLREVALRLRAGVRTGDLACRLGGDEFVVLCEDLPASSDVAVLRMVELAERLLASLAEPVLLGGREITVSASAGVALATDDQRPEALLADADSAMYHAKDTGRGRVELFDAELRAALEQRLEVEHDLRRVLDRDELELWMQPVHRLADGHVLGFEALLRWRHPTKGVLAPGTFLSVAEDTGEIDRVGAWVLRQACARAASWPSGPLGSYTVAVNVSPVQLLSGELPTIVIEALEDSGLPPHLLELEITESVYLRADEHARRQLEQIAGLGVSIAMDDFGTGFSSLTSLRALPVHVVKLDRTFVAGLGVHRMDEAIVRSTIEMAAAMGMRVVGEGIEQDAQRRELVALGCERGQGFLYDHPLPPGAELEVIRGAVAAV